MSKDKKINKVVLAYSGGLDTSVILKWLEEKYECEVVTFTADLGQGAELDDAKEKAPFVNPEITVLRTLCSTSVKVLLKAHSFAFDRWRVIFVQSCHESCRHARSTIRCTSNSPVAGYAG